MLSNKNVAWEIVKVFHPEIDDSLKERLSINCQYDWVLFKTTGVSIGIQFECHLMSGSKPIHLFEKELKSNKFGAWRFVNDSKYKLEKEDDYKYLKLLYCSLVNDILKKNNIAKPTAKQMSDYYHSD